MARPRSVIRAGGRAQDRSGNGRGPSGNPDRSPLWRTIRTPPPAQGCSGICRRHSVRPVVLFGSRQKAGVGLDSGVSCGRRRHAVFHSASLRKKPHRANRSARPAPASCRHGPCYGRCPIMPSLSDFALAAAVLGLRRDRRAAPAGRPSSARRLYRTGVFCKLTPTPSPTPPRSRAADRPQLGFPLPSSRFCKLFPGPSLPARPHRCACGSTPGAPSISLFYCLFQ